MGLCLLTAEQVTCTSWVVTLHWFCLDFSFLNGPCQFIDTSNCSEVLRRTFRSQEQALLPVGPLQAQGCQPLSTTSGPNSRLSLSPGVFPLKSQERSENGEKGVQTWTARQRPEPGNFRYFQGEWFSLTTGPCYTYLTAGGTVMAQGVPSQAGSCIWAVGLTYE